MAMALKLIKKYPRCCFWKKIIIIIDIIIIIIIEEHHHQRCFASLIAFTYVLILSSISCSLRVGFLYARKCGYGVFAASSSSHSWNSAYSVSEITLI